jgi:hypothetical protein
MAVESAKLRSFYSPLDEHPLGVFGGPAFELR